MLSQFVLVDDGIFNVRSVIVVICVTRDSTHALTDRLSERIEFVCLDVVHTVTIIVREHYNERDTPGECGLTLNTYSKNVLRTLKTMPS